MTQEIEIEFKNLLTKEEFDQLLSSLPFPKEGIRQTNYYFETSDFALKKQKSALRIREKNNRFQLTLKQPHEQGLLETHENLTEEEANQWIHGNIITKDSIFKQLEALHIPIQQLQCLGQLTTIRRELVKNSIIYVLDQSTYLDKKDYELEIESPSEEEGIVAMEQILEQFHIPKRKTKNKIERLFAAMDS